MKRNRLNLILDTLSLLVLLAMIETGLVMRYILPPGSGERRMTLWGWSRHDWGDLHFWLSVGLAGLMVVHVALHWQWVCTVTRQWLRGGTPSVAGTGPLRGTAYGLVFASFVLAATGGLFAWGMQNVRRSEWRGDESHGRGWRGGRETMPSVAPTDEIMTEPDHRGQRRRGPMRDQERREEVTNTQPGVSGETGGQRDSATRGGGRGWGRRSRDGNSGPARAD